MVDKFEVRSLYFFSDKQQLGRLGGQVSSISPLVNQLAGVVHTHQIHGRLLIPITSGVIDFIVVPCPDINFFRIRLEEYRHFISTLNRRSIVFALRERRRTGIFHTVIALGTPEEGDIFIQIIVSANGNRGFLGKRNPIRSFRADSVPCPLCSIDRSQGDLHGLICKYSTIGRNLHRGEVGNRRIELVGIALSHKRIVRRSGLRISSLSK